MIRLTSRVVSVCGRKTSMRLTNIEWQILDKICYQEKIKRRNLLELIEENHSCKLGLTPSVRLFALLYSYNKMKSRDEAVLTLQKSLSYLR